MSFLSRIWNSIRSPVRFVGRDLEGNKYYEAKSPHNPDRTKRTVQYYDSEEVWRYIGGSKRLPVQWSAWLTHTRRQPPTLEQLSADLARRQRVLANAAVIEARDRAEAEEMLRIRQRDTFLAVEAAATRPDSVAVPQVPQVPQPEPIPSHSAQPGYTPSTEPQRTAPAAPLPEEIARVRPPAFLTPAAPRNPKSSKSFALPSLEPEPNLEAAPPIKPLGSTSAKETGSGSKSEAKDTFPWKSIIAEMESWAPKARRRG